MQAGAVLVLVAAGFAGVYLHSSNTNEEAAEQRVLAVARTVAAAPIVLDAISSADPSAALQPYADQVRRETGTDGPAATCQRRGRTAARIAR